MALTINSLIPSGEGLVKTAATLIVLSFILRVIRPMAGNFSRFLPNI